MKIEKILVIAGAMVVALCICTALLIGVGRAALPAPIPTHPSGSPASTATSNSFVPLTAAQLAALPEARYDAVIRGLLPYSSASAPEASRTTYELRSDAAIYGIGQRKAVARLAGNNFLSTPTIVVPVKVSGEWALVLTPSRNALPSANENYAAAQTTGWVRFSALTDPVIINRHVVISVSQHTLSIVNDSGTIAAVFPAGVGTASTPTPAGVTGYIQARYLDPAQGQSIHPIQLTSLHSAVADNPYGGVDGGLIGIHFQTTASGAVSHGCIRLTEAGIVALNALPVGTAVTIQD